jgi:signal transduction histidine kinase
VQSKAIPTSLAVWSPGVTLDTNLSFSRSKVTNTTPSRAPRTEAVIAAMVDIARETLGATSEAVVADAIVRTAARLVGADQATLGLVRDGEVITVAAVMPPRMPVGSHFPVGFGVAGWVAATGQAAEIEDVRQDKRYVALPYPEVRSFVGVPLEAGQALVGVLSLAAWRPGAFPSNTAAALRPFREYAALLLQHAALNQQMADRLHALEDSTREGLAEGLHELKAPLHAAAGFLEIVAEEQAGPLNDQQKDFLRTARAECERLKEAIATLIEAGAAGGRPPRLEVVEPRELVQTALERVRGQALTREITLTEEVDPHARPVCVDRGSIQQVLGNLLQNALRLVPSNSEIVVAVTSLPEWTCFMVADRGPGLAEEQLESIFEPYTQGDSRGQERAAGNVGLGLALSRRLIEQHHGMIWAENREGGGSRFCFALPVAETD